MFQRQIVKLSIATLILISGTLSAFADTDISGRCMRLCAEARTNPSQIIISWGSVPAGILPAQSYQIQRDEEPPVTLSGDTLSYTDTNVVAGELYTYTVSKEPDTDASGYTYISPGYVTVGIALPLVESRGKLILIVDSDNAASLSLELTRLRYDLAGDGWTVIRHDVSPIALPPDIKALIQADYNNDPTNVKCVFLFGHIPVAMSGYYGPDGHANRALPTDGYYGDMDGVWTDNIDYGSDNMAEDGKFDAFNTAGLPSGVELAIGRVDLRSMPSFSKSETELLRQYLDKDHNYRHKNFMVREQAIIDDHFGTYAYGDAKNGWRNFSMFVGPTNVLIDNSTWSSSIEAPYHWAYGCGAGNYTTVSGVTTTPQLQNADPGVFTILFGSYFCDWQAANNVMRAVLCTSNYGLTCLWGEHNGLDFNKMAYGEPIGFCMKDMMHFITGVQQALMGDPTLRYHIVTPPSDLRAVSAGGEVDLNWSASSESVLGYHVYRAADVTSEFTRVNTDLISGTAYHDPAPPEKCIYMVRAVTLTEGKSGSYFNASQGIFAEFEALSIPMMPAGVTASDGVYNDKVVVTWTAAGYATGYQIWRSVDNNSSAAIMIGESDEPHFDDLTAVTGTNYYYWVKAINSIGESACSASDLGFSRMEIPLPPEGLTASDGTWSNKVTITWRAPTQAMGYEIWRSLTDNPAGASRIGTSVTTNYDDVSAPADTMCYYWLKAVNAAGASEFSWSDTGFRFTLGSPAVSVSQGMYSNKIVVTWSAVPGALGYEVWRSETLYIQNSVLLTNTVPINIEDTKVSQNKFYYYWVRATNAVGQGAFAGRYSGCCIPPPPSPQRVAASDGLYADKVVVTWGKVTNFTWSLPLGYKVWRSRVNDPATAEQIATTNGGYTNYMDTSVALDTPCYYWVTATNACGASEFSLSDSGYRSMNCAPACPAGISASKYTYTNKITVAWTAVTNANGYELWRGTNSTLANAVLLTSTTGTTFDDTTAVKESYYYYWVRATNAFGISAFKEWTYGIYCDVVQPSLPDWVKASDGTYADRVVVSWSAASNASGYAVYRKKPGGVLTTNDYLVCKTAETNCVDMGTNLVPCILYDYCVVSTNARFGTSGWMIPCSTDIGWQAGGSRLAPSNVHASAGVFTDRVEISWSQVGGATWYQVWRAVSNESVSKLGGATSLTHFTDTNVVAGVSYSYRVSAPLVGGREYISSNAVGWRAFLTAPRNITASDGVFTDKVRINWDAVEGAVGYEVWRYTSTNSDSALKISSIGPSGTKYDDTSAAAGATYYYWVKAVNAAGTSEFSAADGGYRLALADQTIDFPAIGDQIVTNVVILRATSSSRLPVHFRVESGPAKIKGMSELIFSGTGRVSVAAFHPGNGNYHPASTVVRSFMVRGARVNLAEPGKVQAGDGAYTNRIVVTWNGVNGATSYEVWRNTANVSSGAVKIGTVSALLFNDTDVLPGTFYYYWVKARNAVESSGFSNPDSGYAMLVVTDPSDPPSAPIAPTNVSASDSVYPDRIRVTWEGVSEATGYEVWRSLGEISGFAVKLEETITTNYDDTAVEADTTYYYWVKAKNTSGISGFSKSDPGCVLATNMVIRPEISINNRSEAEVTLARGQNVSVAINLATSSHLEADWWMLVETPFGVYYYNVSDGYWYPTDMDNLTTTYQGQLFSFLEAFEVLAMDTAWLNSGRYTFYFGVDIARNGELDFDKLYYSSVTLNVTE